MRRDIFQAIADPVRREIIDKLSDSSLSINQIAKSFDISRPAVSKHVKILEESGVITIEQLGRERICSINPKELVPAFLWVKQYHRLWEERIDSFEDYLNTITKNKTK